MDYYTTFIQDSLAKHDDDDPFTRDLEICDFFTPCGFLKVIRLIVTFYSPFLGNRIKKCNC